MIDLDNYSVGREKTASHIYINTDGLNKTPMPEFRAHIKQATSEAVGLHCLFGLILCFICLFAFPRD